MGLMCECWMREMRVGVAQRAQGEGRLGVEEGGKPATDTDTTRSLTGGARLSSRRRQRPLFAIRRRGLPVIAGAGAVHGVDGGRGLGACGAEAAALEMNFIGLKAKW